MKVFTTTNSVVVAQCPLPFLLGEIDQYNNVGDGWNLKISTNVVEGSETASVIADDSINEEIKKCRTTAAQAGNYVVGYAPISVVEQEFADYQYYCQLPITAPTDMVAFRGVLKVSQTPVFTPQFLSYENAQFAL
jgi:hypothetical protein